MSGACGHALGTAVDSPAILLDGNEQQVPVDRRVTLTTGTDERRAQSGVGRIGNVVNLEPVEVAHDGVITGDGEVRVHEAEVARCGIHRRDSWNAGQFLQIADGLFGVVVARRQTDPRIVLG